MESKYIEDVKYSEELKSMRILAKPQLWLEYKEKVSDNFYRDYRNGLVIKEYIIYLPDETKEEVLEAFRANINNDIEMMG